MMCKLNWIENTLSFIFYFQQVIAEKITSNENIKPYFCFADPAVSFQNSINSKRVTALPFATLAIKLDSGNDKVKSINLLAFQRIQLNIAKIICQYQRQKRSFNIEVSSVVLIELV